MLQIPKICYKGSSGFSGRSGSSVGSRNYAGLSFSRQSYNVLTAGGLREDRGYVTTVNGESYGVNLDNGMVTHIRSGMGVLRFDSDGKRINAKAAAAVKEAAQEIDRVKRENPKAYQEAVERRRSAKRA